MTGGAGFIGSNFIRYVLATQPDVRVTNYDKLTYAGKLESLLDVARDPRYAFVRGDICDSSRLAEVLPGHDAVVNFAAESHVDRSIDHSGDFILANCLGANTLFNVAMRLEIGRFLHISTDEVYGSVQSPDSFREIDGLRPSSPYSVSKASADLLARAYWVTFGYPITVTRTTNNFGPFHYPEKVVPLFVTNLLDGQKVPLYGTGANVRDWTYVLDNAAAQWLVLTRGQPGEVYNVGAGNELSNRELTERILGRFGFGEEMIQLVGDRPGHDLRYAVDATKVRKLGWMPAHGFDEALDATIEWYRVNEWWWRPLKERGASRRQGLVRASGGRGSD
ncbi:MAG: dTDP-glucose 4,6-dehydratase [Egibacteraceae bacterium]